MLFEVLRLFLRSWIVFLFFVLFLTQAFPFLQKLQIEILERDRQIETLLTQVEADKVRTDWYTGIQDLWYTGSVLACHFS